MHKNGWEHVAHLHCKWATCVCVCVSMSTLLTCIASEQRVHVQVSVCKLLTCIASEQRVCMCGVCTCFSNFDNLTMPSSNKNILSYKTPIEVIPIALESRWKELSKHIWNAMIVTQLDGENCSKKCKDEHGINMNSASCSLAKQVSNVCVCKLLTCIASEQRVCV